MTVQWVDAVPKRGGRPPLYLNYAETVYELEQRPGKTAVVASFAQVDAVKAYDVARWLRRHASNRGVRLEVNVRRRPDGVRDVYAQVLR